MCFYSKIKFILELSSKSTLPGAYKGLLVVHFSGNPSVGQYSQYIGILKFHRP